MTAIYRLVKNKNDAWCDVNPRGELRAVRSSVPQNRAVDDAWYVALDGRCVRSFDITFPKRVWDVLSAALFALEGCASEPVSSQSMWLQSCTWSKHARGFALSKTEWASMKKRMLAVPTLPSGVFPDYLFLPWQPGQITIAKEGTWCRVRSGLAMGYSVSMTSVSLLLESLVAENTFENVLVYTDDSSLDWQGLTELATMVFEQQAPWRVDSLPRLSKCQDRLSLSQHAREIKRKTREALATSKVGQAACVLGLSVLGVAFAMEFFLLVDNHRLQNTMQAWLHHHVSANQQAAFWHGSLTSLNHLIETQTEDPTLFLLERSSRCAPAAIQSWIWLGVTATPKEVQWRYQPKMPLSWKRVKMAWANCAKQAGLQWRVRQRTEPLSGITISMEKHS